jgi:hypothetical protein
MPSVSKAQQALMGQAYAIKTGKLKPGDLNPEYRDQIVDLAKSMGEDDLKDYAETPSKKLPNKIGEMKNIPTFESFLNGLLNEAMSFDEIKDKFTENPYGIGAQGVEFIEGERGNPNRLVFRSGERSRRDEIAKKLKAFGIPAKKMSNSTQDKAYKYRYVLTLFESAESNEIEINEGAILNSIKPGLEGDVKVAVGALETLLQSTGAILDYKHADKLADCIIDIIDAAKQEARDEYSD